MIDGAIILAVDDNPANLDVAVRFLGDAGCRVLVARNGERAIERAMRTPPELILMDVKMPGIDGFEVCQRLKGYEPLRDVPVILMTALTDEASKKRAFDVGAADYISKPITRGELIGRVTTQIENARYRRKLESEVERRAEHLRRELAEKELLIREVHHRVKNNLSVVASLLQLQLASVKAGADAMQALRASAERIHAMSHVHQQIYETGRISSLDLNEYVQSLARELQAGYDPEQRVSIHTQLDSVVVDVDVAIPCGIIVNELVTNALKHGFPDGARGTVSVELRDEPDERFRLVVADDGVGCDLNSVNTSGSLGTTLVRTLSEQIRGELSFSNASGTRIEILIPFTS